MPRPSAPPKRVLLSTSCPRCRGASLDGSVFRMKSGRSSYYCPAPCALRVIHSSRWRGSCGQGPSAVVFLLRGSECLLPGGLAPCRSPPCSLSLFSSYVLGLYFPYKDQDSRCSYSKQVYLQISLRFFSSSSVGSTGSPIAAAFRIVVVALSLSGAPHLFSLYRTSFPHLSAGRLLRCYPLKY